MRAFSFTTKWLAIAPPYGWLLLFFGLPFFIVLKISFAEPVMGSPPYTPLFAKAADGSLTLAASATTYATIAFLEGADRTAPWGRMRTKSVSGTTIRFTWAGSDPLLQTHTAGLRDFNVQYRVDSGAWTQIRTATTATSIALSSRRHGHYYTIRVQARDRRGNLSSWSAGLWVWVP